MAKTANEREAAAAAASVDAQLSLDWTRPPPRAPAPRKAPKRRASKRKAAPAIAAETSGLAPGGVPDSAAARAAPPRVRGRRLPRLRGLQHLL